MDGWNWIHAYLPALQRFLAGGDPYQAVPVGPYLNPPWLLPLLLPFYWLGTVGGDIALKLFSILGLIVLGLKMKQPWAIVLTALSYPFLYTVLNSNVDAFALWGLAAGGPLGFFLLSVKPQVASLVGLLWMWQEYKKRSWRGLLELTLPTVLAAAGATILYPQWVRATLSATSQPEGATLNLWPYLAPLGILLLYRAFKRNGQADASLATNLVVPYIRANSYVGSLALVAGDNLLVGLLFFVVTWLFVLFRA